MTSPITATPIPYGTLTGHTITQGETVLGVVYARGYGWSFHPAANQPLLDHRILPTLPDAISYVIPYVEKGAQPREATAAGTPGASPSATSSRN